MVASAVFLGCALAPASGFAEPGGGVSAKDTTPLIFKKARIVSDGFLTPGQIETVAVTRLPPKAIVEAAIEPPPTTPQCGQLYFCDFVRIFPSDGTPRFRSNGNGQSVLTFVMPTSYIIELDPFGKHKQPVNFANGQSVHIDVQCKKKTKKKRFLGFGFGRAVVQLGSS